MNLLLETIWTILQVLFTFLEGAIRWIIPSRYKSVKNEVCLITGAGSGIGRLMALEFAKRGATLVLWDVNENGNKETAKMITERGGRAFHDKCDVSDRGEVSEAAQRAREKIGSDVTMVVNNAGIVYGKDFLNITDEQIEKTIKVNSLAHFWVLREFLPGMLDKNHGHFVTIASIAGLVPGAGMPAYVSSKHAAVGFHNALTLDVQRYKKFGVKSTLVCPYHINTGMFSGVGSRFPNLLAPLDPEYCVERIMHAVLSDQTMVAIPRTMYFMHNISTWIPFNAGILLNKFLGALDFMNKFTPNRDYQKEAFK